MSTKIFVNLPVKDLNKSKEFFTKLGYKFNAQFTNDVAGCLVISDDIYAMLITEPLFKTFTPKEICDTKKYTETLICLTCKSRQAVDDIVQKAFAAGGTKHKEPQDHGFMYGHSFQDLDGHSWEWVYMDPSHVQKT